MKVRSTFARPALFAALAVAGILALVGGIGAVFFKSTPVSAATQATGLTPVEAALGVGSKPVTLTSISAKSTTGFGRVAARPASDLRITGSTVAMVAPKSFPKPKPKASPRPAPAKPAPARRTPSSARVASVHRSSAPVTGGAWKVAKCSTYGIGDGLVGHGMANGDPLTETGMYVAHKSLPFGTRIQFSYNGHTCVAKVTDRGPFVSGREFDLGPGPARALGFGGVDYLRWRVVH